VAAFGASFLASGAAAAGAEPALPSVSI